VEHLLSERQQESKNESNKKINIKLLDLNLTNYSGFVPISRLIINQRKFKKHFSDDLGLDRGLNSSYSTYKQGINLIFYFVTSMST